MEEKHSRLETAEAVGRIFGSVAAPIAVVVIGWMFQTQMSSDSIKKDYVQMSLQILQTNTKDQQLREWAVKVLNNEAPIPLSTKLQNDIVTSAVPVFVPAVLKPPADLMTPPLPLIPLLDKKGDVTGRDLLENYEKNLGNARLNSIQLEYLQKYVSIYAEPDKHMEPAKSSSAPAPATSSH
jgi:hypothetical protein